MKLLVMLKGLNCEGFSSSMLHFNNFINLAEFMDLPFQGQKFTRCNSLSASQIDRGLVNVQVDHLWSFMTLTALPRKLSNHNPILFAVELHVNWGLKPFRSLDYWWEHESFAIVLQEAWGWSS